MAQQGQYYGGGGQQQQQYQGDYEYDEYGGYYDENGQYVEGQYYEEGGYYEGQDNGQYAGNNGYDNNAGYGGNNAGYGGNSNAGYGGNSGYDGNAGYSATPAPAPAATPGRDIGSRGRRMTRTNTMKDKDYSPFAGADQRRKSIAPQPKGEGFLSIRAREQQPLSELKSWADIKYSGSRVSNDANFICGFLTGLIFGPIGFVLCCTTFVIERVYARRYGCQLGFGILMFAAGAALFFYAITERLSDEQEGKSDGLSYFFIASMTCMFAVIAIVSSWQQWNEVKIDAKRDFAVLTGSARL